VKKACYGYNDDKCNKTDCGFEHVCEICKLEHRSNNTDFHSKDDYNSTFKLRKGNNKNSKSK